ncbi:MAG: hypothetical protein KJN81_10415, partial [Acidimicrobiia bacterium]|nr:hypothetical protein [Acidimicrobiia bacterium]NNL28828.1 hypothetical protein [Acidimicrobiia bacterium]
LYIIDNSATTSISATTSEATASAAGESSKGTIAELTLEPAVQLNATVGSITATLVRATATSQWNPPSPDPAGLAFNSAGSDLLVSDSEVNEMSIWAGANLFRSNLSGGLTNTYNTTSYSDEPTGIAYNPLNGHIFISDDTGRTAIYEVDGFSGNVVNSITENHIGTVDAEGIAFDPAGNGTLYLVDGVSEEIFVIQPGPNGFDNGSSINQFDVTNLGVIDPEGVEFNPDNGNLYVLSKNDTIAEVTTSGTLIRYIDMTDINPRKPAGLAYAPASNNPSQKNLYVVARGTDNNSDPNENDGEMFEISFTSGIPPTVDAGPDQTIEYQETANLDGTVSDDGLPNPPGAVTTTWSVVTGPGSVTFGNSSDVDTTATFTDAGAYLLRLTADDGENLSSDDLIVTMNGGGGASVVDVRVSANSDDAEEDATGPVDLGSSDLELVYDSGGNQTVGIRFASVNIPKGASIANAYVQFQVDEINTEPTNLTIRGQAADNPPTFTSTAYSISARPTTAAGANWSPPAWSTVGAAGLDQRTPPLNAVIQEIVNRPGWSANNAIALIVTGTGERTAESSKSNQQSAPLLHVEYTVGNQAPVVDAGPDDIINLPPGEANLDGTVSDDGLPASPGAVTTTWTAQGPAAVTFGDPGSVDTTATFTQTGTYTLTLTAYDGELYQSDTVSITVVDQPTNTAPTVSAGTGQSITLPNEATLDGTINDDGLPIPPGTVTTTWSASGPPGTVTFADDTAVDTSAAFSVDGTYFLTLSAYDGQYTVEDTIEITVSPEPPNLPPTVDAGPAQTVALPGGVTLDGTVTDDGLPNPPSAFTTEWTASGPGTVTFADSTAVDTTATFSQDGVYTLTLTADDTGAIASDTVTITVDPAPDGFYYLTFTSGTTVPGLGSVQDEDIVTYDPSTGSWAMYFDGSDVGIAPGEINAIHIRDDGSILMSLDSDMSVPGIIGGPDGTNVDESDVFLFTPTSTGTNTSGTFSFHFDGSDMGLAARSEDIDAIYEFSDGTLAISTKGSFKPGGIPNGSDEDIHVFTGTYGSETSGSFSLYFDGSDIGFGGVGNHDIDGVSFSASDIMYFSTVGTYTAAGGSGDDEDVSTFVGSFGSTTTGTAALTLDLTGLGIAAGEDLNGLHVVG